MADRPDPDFPGERESFVPASETAVVADGEGRLVVVGLVPKSIEEQRSIHHNQIRYVELLKLRRGQPNRYLETRYR